MWQNVFSVVHELRNPTQARVDCITRSAILTALLVYGVIAVAGFCTYGSEVESNILVNYPSKRKRWHAESFHTATGLAPAGCSSSPRMSILLHVHACVCDAVSQRRTL